MFNYKFTVYFLIAFLGVSIAKAEVKLASLFTDNMVLQQKAVVPIWGWTDVGKKVKVSTSWNGKSYTATADASGKWLAKVETPAAGGPYDITISDGKALKLSNVLIGEVWICGGQSNILKRGPWFHGPLFILALQ